MHALRPFHQAIHARLSAWSCSLILFLLLPVAASYAQNANLARGYYVRGIDQKVGDQALSPARKQSALLVADKVRTILERNSAIFNPSGYSIRLSRIYGAVPDLGNFESGLPFYAGAMGTFFNADVKPNAGGMGSPDFAVYVNTVLGCPFSVFSPKVAHGEPWLLNGKLPVLQGGRHTGEIHGFPIYDGQCAILGRNQQPAFLPLTREQYLQLTIVSLQHNIEKMKKDLSASGSSQEIQQMIHEGISGMNQIIGQEQQQIQSMSAADRRSPAAVRSGDDESGLVDPNSKDAVALSVPNPALFNPSLPAGTIQSVAVYVPFLQTEEIATGLPPGLPAKWVPACRTIRDHLDWSALAALVH